MMKLWMAPHGLHIEPGRASDAEVLARLHAQGFYRGWPSADFASYLTQDETPVLVACDSKRRIAGFIMLRLLGDDSELITIAVDPKWRGKGVGRALLRAAFDDLMRTPARRMLLEVAADNPAALKLYRSEGFVEIGRRGAYYARAEGTPVSALVMARDLG